MSPSFWDVAWYFFAIFVFVAYLCALFGVVIDVFRDHSLRGWEKALWILLLVFLPIFTVLLYLGFRGRGMADRANGVFQPATSARHSPRMSESADEEARRRSQSSTPAADIATAKDLLERQIINQGEFDALKNKSLGNKY